MVLRAVFNCRNNWFHLCLDLQVSPDDLSSIEERGGDPGTCLHRGLTHWLQGDYDTEKHGSPTWRMLVAAVDNPSGGNDSALASDIAKKHQGKFLQSKTICGEYKSTNVFILQPLK